MTTLIRFSPPSAYIVPNMIGADGLIPAAREYVTGFRRLGGFRVGQPIRAYDEDGNGYSGQIARVERDLLYLAITERDASWEIEHSRYLDVLPGATAYRPIGPSEAAPGPALQADPSRWVRV